MTLRSLINSFSSSSFSALGLSTALAATALVACGDDKDTTTESQSGTTDSPTSTDGTMGGTTADPTPTTSSPGTTMEDPTTGGTTEAPNDTAADGEPCTANGDCQSLSCVKFFDAQTDAVCEAAPDGGVTRFTGTLFDFVTKAPVPMTELRVVGALAALQDPTNATPVVTATSDAMGRVDATSAMPVKEGIGVIGLVGGGASPYYITATGLAAPAAGVYPPLNGIHDIWTMPTATLVEWSGFLALDPDPAVMMAQPLGEKGGVVGLVRDAATGEALAGGVVKSEKMGSTALIRYLNEDGLGFNEAGTSDNGVFVLMGPALAETFTVEIGGAATGLSGTAGSAEGAVFVLIFNVT